MGYRITWRSRPRSEYPWPLRVRETTVADLLAGEDGITHSAIGPLTMDAVSELVYRVEEMAFGAYLTASRTPDPDITYARTGTMKLAPQADASASDELDQFRASSYKFDGVRPFSVNLEALNDGIGSEAGGCSLYAIGVDSDNPWYSEKVDVWKDENGDFWLVGFISWTFYDTDTATLVRIGTERESRLSPSEHTSVTIDLVLSSGTYPIKGVAVDSTTPPNSSPITASLTLTASKWFPFKTNAGADAWDTATGLPINGGPSK